VQSRKRSQESGGGSSKSSGKADAQEKLPQAAAEAASAVANGSLSDCEVDTNILSMNRWDSRLRARGAPRQSCLLFPAKMLLAVLTASRPQHSRPRFRVWRRLSQQRQNTQRVQEEAANVSRVACSAA
jgi:hypothetical protein